MDTSASGRMRPCTGHKRTGRNQVPPAAIVVRWVQAFNARDLDAMLACLAEEVDLHPLRLGGAAVRYLGHAGVREWFDRLAHASIDYRIVLEQARDLGGGKVSASGSLSFGEDLDIGPFCALHRVQRGLIVDLRQYVSEPDMIERVGLIP